MLRALANQIGTLHEEGHGLCNDLVGGAQKLEIAPDLVEQRVHPGQAAADTLRQLRELRLALGTGLGKATSHATEVHLLGRLPCAGQRVLREASDLGGDDRKTAPGIAGPRGLDRGVERQDVDLLGDAADVIQHLQRGLGGGLQRGLGFGAAALQVLRYRPRIGQQGALDLARQCLAAAHQLDRALQCPVELGRPALDFQHAHPDAVHTACGSSIQVFDHTQGAPQ